MFRKGDKVVRKPEFRRDTYWIGQTRHKDVKIDGIFTVQSTSGLGVFLEEVMGCAESHRFQIAGPTTKLTDWM